MHRLASFGQPSLAFFRRSLADCGVVVNFEFYWVDVDTKFTTYTNPVHVHSNFTPWHWLEKSLNITKMRSFFCFFVLFVVRLTEDISLNIFTAKIAFIFECVFVIFIVRLTKDSRNPVLANGTRNERNDQSQLDRG